MDNGNIVIIVMDRSHRIVASQVLPSSRYRSPENHERAIARAIGHFEHKYPGPDYVIHQGSARNVASFLTVYPELARSHGV